jgi:adenylate kinase family enzyme
LTLEWPRGHSSSRERLVKRIAILGPGGAGKSRLAVALGEVIGAKVLYLDRMFWQPGWVPREAAEWNELQRKERAAKAWIVEGMTEHNTDPWLDEADTVVLLDTPPLTCIWRVTTRRLTSKEGIGLPAGCDPAPPHRAFMKFLRRLWQYERTTLPALKADLARRRDDQRVVVLRNDREIQKFLTSARGTTRARPVGELS